MIPNSHLHPCDEGTNDPCPVLGVTGMVDFEIMVEVCKKSLNSKNTCKDS